MILATRSTVVQAAVTVGAGIVLFLLASLLPTICPAVMGEPYCGPTRRRRSATELHPPSIGQDRAEHHLELGTVRGG